MGDDRKNNSITEEQEEYYREHFKDLNKSRKDVNYINLSLLSLILIIGIYRVVVSYYRTIFLNILFLFMLVFAEYISLSSYARKINRKVNCFVQYAIAVVLNICLAVITQPPSQAMILLIVGSIAIIFILFIWIQVFNNKSFNIENTLKICLTGYIICFIMCIMIAFFIGDLHLVELLSVSLLGVILSYL